MRRARQYNPHQAASPVGSIGDFNGTSMSLRNLAREYQPHPTAAGFCRIERRENVSRVQKARAVIFDEQVHLGFRGIPMHTNLSISVRIGTRVRSQVGVLRLNRGSREFEN